MTNRRTESGNIFFALFGAVALIGVVGAATSTLMRGPLSTVVSVNQRAKADTQMQIASKLAMVRATQEVANGGDCDMDGTIEPIPPDAMTGATLVGGGALPASIGSSQIDPWNTRYGYCVWDLGAKVDDPACDSGSRLGGGLNESYPVMVIISAGPDKTFQTECNAWVGGGSAPYVPDNADVLVDRAKNTPNDDIVLGYTYSEAVQAAGGLWSLMSGDPDTITTDKNVAFSSGNVDFSAGTTANFQGSAQFAQGSSLDLRNPLAGGGAGGGLFLLPTQAELPDNACLGANATANDGALRINTEDYVSPTNATQKSTILEICDKVANAFQPLGGAGATVAKIDDLTDAISYAGKGILFMGDGAGMSYSSTTGGMNNIGIGIGAASSLVTGAGNIVLGDHPLTAGTSNSIVLGNGVNGVVGNNALRLGNLLYGSNIYSSSGSLGIGGVPSATLDVNGPAEANRFQMDNNTYMGSVSSDMIWVTGGATNMMLNATGNLGIGATPTGSRLTVGGDAYVDGQTSSNNVIVRDNGSAGIPSLRFGSASGSGFYTNGGSIGFATGGNNRAWLNDNGFGIGTTPSVALDVVGQGVFTDRVTSTGFQFSSGQGMFPSGSGLSLNAGGTPQFYLSALGNVGIGVASPNAALDVDGAIRVGFAADSECDTARAGSIRYTSGDRLQICSDSTGDWETIGTSGGGGGGSGSYWSRVSTIDPRLYYTLGDVGVGVSDPLADFHVNGNLLTTGTFGSGDVTPVTGSGTRMMFIPNKGAFRAGTVTAGNWDHAQIGNYSTALGYNTLASGVSSFAMGGNGTTATGDYSTAIGRLADASGNDSFAWGSKVRVAGSRSVGLGLGVSANFGWPSVSGTGSMGIFMQDQTGVDIATNNLLALLGGRMIIDPNPVSATNVVPSGLLTVDVQGDIGAVQYCDENGANCFTAADIAGGGVGVWEDASNVIRLTSGTVNYSSADYVFGSPQLDNDGVASHYARVLFDKSKGAFRAGYVDGNWWNAAEMGDASIGLGYNTWAKGNNSIAIGNNVGVLGVNGIAMGQEVDVEGDNSVAFGMGSTSGVDPKVSGSRSYGIFMGEQGGVNLSSSNTFGLFGGKMIIDPRLPAGKFAPSASLTLNIEGQVGATEYCDQDGLNCFTAAGIGSAYGADGTIQFASAGKFHSNPDFRYDMTTNNVGIGNAAPTQKLHVTGKIRATQSLMLDPVAGAAPLFMNLTDLGDTNIGAASGGDILIYNSSTGRWVNSPAGAMTVSAAGANREVQFNNNGSFGASANFSYTPTGRLILEGPGTNSVVIKGGNETMSGASNTILGRTGTALSTGNNNTLVGFNAGLVLTTGSSNTALGSEALATATGADNTALGRKAGNNITTGGGNIMIGNDVQAATAAGNFQLNIGDVITGDMFTGNIAIAGTAAFRVPAGATAQRPLPAVNGMLRYNSTNNRFEGYQNGSWQDMLSGSASGSFLTLTDTPSSYAGVPNQYVRVNAATNALEFTDQLVGTFTGQPAPNFISLDDLSDVNLSVAPTNGQVLRYDSASSMWLAGGAPASSAAGAQGEVQLNEAGLLGANSMFSYSNNRLRVGLTSSEDTPVNHNAGPTYSGMLNVIKFHDDTVGAIHAGIHSASIGTSKDVYALIGQRRNGSNWTGGTAVGAGQYLPGIAFAGQTSATQGPNLGMQIGASIVGLVDGTVSAGVIPTSITMHTSQTNNLGLVERMRITSAGDVIMSGTGAMKIPSGDNAQRPTPPSNGMLRYNSTSNKFEGYQGGVWQDLLTNAATASAAGSDGQVQFNNSGALGASAGLSFTSSTGAMTVGRSATIGSTDVNGVLIAGAATGIAPTISSTGSDTNVSLNFATKGAGSFNFSAGSFNAATFSAVNDAFVTVAGNTAASRAGISLKNNGVNQWNMMSNPSLSQLQFSFSNSVNASPVYVLTGSGNGIYYGTGALRLNAGTSAERPASPSNGMLRYNSTSNKFEGFQGGAWQDILTGAASGGTFLALTDTPSSYASAANQFVRVNAATTALEFTDQVIGSVTGQPLPSFIDLNDLGDVDLTVAPTNGQVLKYDNASGTWKAAAGAAAGGANTQIQYNNAGSLAGSPVFAFVSNEVVLNASSVNKPGVLRIKGAESPVANYLDAMVALESTASGDIWSQAIMSGQPGRVGDYAFAHYNGSTWAEPLTFAKNNRIGIFAVTPLASFDINTNDAMIVPRGTTAQQPSSPVNGMLRYNTTTAKFEGYQSGAWVNMIGGGGGGTPAGATGEIQYNSGGAFAAHSGLNYDGAGTLTVRNFVATGSTYAITTQNASASGTAVYGLATDTAGSNFGVSGQSNSTNGSGLYGIATATTGGTFGVRGQAASTSAKAVSGSATSATGASYGVYGSATSTGGFGVYGYTSAATGATYGVYGLAQSTGGTALYGSASATTGITRGLYASAASVDGTGVYGYASAASGSTFGTYGWSSSTAGVGARGIASATTGTNYGVYGSSTSTGGYGVYGVASAASGTTYGVYGSATSANGYALYGAGNLHVTGNISYVGTLTDTSDMRLKTDIHPLRNRGSMLDKIGALDTYSFRMKDDTAGTVEFGVMAQEIQKIFPELVVTDTRTPDNYLSVNYIGLIAPLVEATKELKAENDNLKSQLSSLESKMASIEADMKGMKAHTGYGISKAGFGLGMAGGLALIGGFGGVLLVNRRRKAA